MESDRGRKKILSFQGLRGLGILLIFLFHCGYIQNRYGGNIFGWAGALGVSIFIFLSGYLAVRNIHTTEQISAKEIVVMTVRKMKKFYPLHLFTLLAALPFSIRGGVWGAKLGNGVSICY